ncbi:hypothetical protein [Streptomyces sp. NPDC056361]|uniref:hypothetical protein n=1 Tax=Streptomyces sp. NPDC056361 TaxID=3345795 RepID=UPI0035D7E8EF
MLAGGLLTEYAGWRWVMLINLPIVAAALALVLAGVPAEAPPARRARPDAQGRTRWAPSWRQGNRTPGARCRPHRRPGLKLTRHVGDPRHRGRAAHRLRPHLILQCDFVIPHHVGRAWWLPDGVLPDRAEDIGKPDQVVAHGPVRVGE